MSGLGGFFNPDNAFFSFMGKVFDVIALNLIWLCVYIPAMGFLYLYGTTEQFIFLVLTFASLIVFIPSMIALYYSTVKAIRRQRSYAIKEFFRSFKDNFAQGAIATVVLAIFIWLLYIDFGYSWSQSNEGSKAGLFMLALFMAITFCVTGTFIYLCPVLSRFQMKLLNAFRFSFGIAMRHIWCTLLSILLWGAIALLVYLAPIFIAILICPGMLVESFMMEKVLKKYVLKTMEQQAAEKAKDAEMQDGEEASQEEAPEYAKSFEEGVEEKKDEWYLE